MKEKLSLKLKRFLKECITDFKKVPSWIIALSVVAAVLMNLLANKTLYSDGSYLSLDCGFLISWVMFLCMDIATQKYGPKASITITLFDVLVALLFSGIMFGIAAIPQSQVSGWFGAEGLLSEEIAGTLNGVVGGTWLVVLTSLFAFICASGVDIFSNVTFGKWMEKSPTFKNCTGKRTVKGFFIYFVRAYGSTFLSQLTDNLVFQMIAYPLLFNIPCTPFSVFMGALVGAVAELIMELAFAPVGYLAITKTAKKEELTVFD